MTPAALTRDAVATLDDAEISTGPSDVASTIEQLQGHIRSMQSPRLDARLIPTAPAIADLLPGGGLKQGAMYSLQNSATLLLALLAAPSAAGLWCGIVGVPEFGIEAAASFGI